MFVEYVEDNEDPALYDGAEITKWESLLSILNLFYRHKMPKVLLSNLLKLIKLHIPSPNCSATSNYKFFKNFDNVFVNMQRHYYCQHCVKPLDNENDECDCDGSALTSYFLDIPIKDQLQKLYERPGFFELLNYRFERQVSEGYSDIFDGKIYKELRGEGQFLRERHNISLLWYTDGMKVFRKSKYEIWPVFMVINELPYAQRMKISNLLLLSLWFGESKPNWEYILDKLYLNVKVLKEGIDLTVYGLDTPIRVKGGVICGTCDSPAKADVLNMKRFNAAFGCATCKHPGKSAEEFNAKQVRVYDPVRTYPLRNETEHAIFVDQTRHSNGSVCGVKGKTIMSSIAYKFLETTVVDPMHCTFEGTVKKILNLWFNDDFKDYGFRKSAVILQRVDERLLSFKPPSHVQRLQRSIKNHLAHWKGHEFKNFLFYYALVILHDSIPEDEFDMMKLLVHGITLLWKDCVSEDDLRLSEQSLNEFVHRFKDVFTLRHVTSVIHLDLHLPLNVKNFGPLPMTSCFGFEDILGKLKKFVTGTNSPHLQICQALSAFKAMETLNDKVLQPGRLAYEFVECINYKVGRLSRQRIDDCTYIIGKSILENDHQLLTEEIRTEGIIPTKIFSFQRLLKNKYMYVARTYQRQRRTNNCSLEFVDTNGRMALGGVKLFVRAQVCNCELEVICNCDAQHYAIIKKYTVREAFQSPISNEMLYHIYRIQNVDNFDTLINVKNIKSICFGLKLVDDQTQEFIAKIVNSTEFE